jgi:hypothetical protein
VELIAMTSTVIIRGSWGHLKVDRATGFIIEYDPEYTLTEDEPGYSDIAFVMPETLAPGRDWCLDKHGETDILCVSYVTTGGVVVPFMSQVPDHTGEGIFHDLPRLPAPAPFGWSHTS